MEFFENLEIYADSVALITENKELTYNEIINSADELATFISHRSLVFILCSNSEESIIGYLSCLRSKNVPLLISSNINTNLLTNLCKKYQPNFIWLPTDKVSIDFYHKITEIGNYVLVKPKHNILHNLYSELSILLMTSGSTGSPLLVRQSSQNLICNTHSIIKSLNIKSTDKPITTLPFNYTYGLSILNSHLYSGSPIILTDRSIISKEFWNLLSKNEATTFGGVPYTYQMLNRIGFEKMEIPSLKYITQAGGKLGESLAFKFAEICERKGIDFIVMYGQTEATARMSYLPAEYAKKKAGSIGISIPGGKFSIHDDQGNEINTAEVLGELIYEGENVSLGYAQEPEDLIKGDENSGILKTGDIAKRDEDGFYYIEGRLKRFVKIFGNRISLDEIESILKTNGFTAVCSGIDDNLMIYSEEQESLDNIKKLISKTTGFHPSAIKVYFVEKIPRNESGKVLYPLLNQF